VEFFSTCIVKLGKAAPKFKNTNKDYKKRPEIRAMKDQQSTMTVWDQKKRKNDLNYDV